MPAYKGDLQYTYVHEPEPPEDGQDGGGELPEDLPALG